MTEYAKQLDWSGLSCPLPIAKTAKEMKEVESGALVEVLATDPGSVPDFDAWAKTTGNELVEQTEEGGTFRFVLRKK
jgi:tRNA 2-thiouridine synthesizing protein A